MVRFGWTRLAYLLLVLTVLAVLARPDTQGAETRPLAADAPQDAAPAGEGPSIAAKPPETPDMSRRIEREISSLVDLGGDEGPPETQEHLAPARTSAPDAAPSEVHDHGTTPPVFFRPSAGGRSSGGAPADGAGPICGDLGRFPESSRVVFPLEERYFYSYEDTWGAPRVQGGHEGTDLMAPAGVPEYAVTDGTVVPVAGSNENGWNPLGGYAVMVRADYSVGPVKAGDLFYYAHLGRPSPLKIGARVRAGQVVGYAGDTGQGPEVTRGLFPAHLHLGWYDATGSRSEAGSGAMNPYPLLEWIKANGGAVTGGSNARYCEAPTPLTPVPSTGQGDWPAPESPGLRPDLDTGSNDPKPSPVLHNDARGHTRLPTAEWADPAKRPAPAPRNRPPQNAPKKEDQRDAPEEVPAIGQPQGPPKPQALVSPDPESPSSKPSRREPSEPPTSDKQPAERPTPGKVEADEPEATPVTPDLQDLLEALIPGPDPADEDRPDLTEKDRQDEKREKVRAKQESRDREKRDREERPPGGEPEDPSQPPVERTPPEEEPSPPPPESTTPEETGEPEPEATEPATTEASETTTG